MATHQSAVKRSRQAKRHALRNREYRSTMRTMLKKVLDSKDKSSAEKSLRSAVALLDKMAARRVIHPNKAANQKSRLDLHFKKLP